MGPAPPITEQRRTPPKHREVRGASQGHTATPFLAIPHIFLNLLRRSPWVVPAPTRFTVLFWPTFWECLLNKSAIQGGHSHTEPHRGPLPHGMSSATASLSSSLLPSRRKGGQGIVFSAQKTNGAELPLPRVLGAPSRLMYGSQG